MTAEAKLLVKRTALSAALVVSTLLIFRTLLPWVLLAMAAWWAWNALKK